MELERLSHLAQEALLLGVALSLPAVVIGGVASLLMAVVQAATQVHDITLAHLPRFLAVAITLVVAGPWIGAQLVMFTQRAFGGG